MIILKYRMLTMLNSMKQALLISLLVCSLSACIGKTEALKTINDLDQATDALKEVTSQLKEAHTKEIEAHNVTRDSLTSILKQYQKTYSQKALESLDEAKKEALIAIDIAYWETVTDLIVSRSEFDEKLQTKIGEKLKNLEKLTHKLEANAETARKRAEQFSSDVSVQADFQKADRAYLANAASLLDIQYGAYERGIKELDQSTQRALEKYKTVKGDLYKQVEDSYNQAIKKVIPLTISVPEPKTASKLPEGYDIIIDDYVAEQKKGLAAIKVYIESNSLGKNSFFAKFLTSLAKGAFAGLLGKGEDVSISDVEEAANDVINPIVNGLNTDLKATLAQVSGKFTKAKEDATRDITESITDAALAFIGVKTEKNRK